MAHCEDYIELISAAVDGALSPAEQEKLNAHLASCAKCQRLYDDLLSLHTVLADLPPVEVPAGLKDRIMDAVAAEAESGKVLPFPPKKTSRHWQRWLASAAVLAVVVMGTWSWKPWESRADLPRSNEVTADRGMDSASFTVTGAAGAADGASPAAPASDPSVLPELASAPIMKKSGVIPASDRSGDSQPAETTPVVNDPVDQPSPAIAPQSAPIPSDGFDPETAVYGAVAPSETAPIQPAAVQPRLFSAPIPQSIPSPAEEGAPEQSVTSQAEAVNVLVNYIYEFVGDVEPVGDSGDSSYAVNSPTGVSGVVTCVGEDEEVYFLDYRDDLSPDVFHYSVGKLTGEVLLLGEEERPSDLP